MSLFIHKNAPAPQRNAFVLAVVLLVLQLFQMLFLYWMFGNPYGPPQLEPGFFFYMAYLVLGWLLLLFYIAEARGWLIKAISLAGWIVSGLYFLAPTVLFCVAISREVWIRGVGSFNDTGFYFALAVILLPLGLMALSIVSIIYLVSPRDGRKM